MSFVLRTPGCPAVPDGRQRDIRTLATTALVTGENAFYDPPPEGSVYVMINITAAYNGSREQGAGLSSPCPA
jgi:hypothetical protein